MIIEIFKVESTLYKLYLRLYSLHRLNYTTLSFLAETGQWRGTVDVAIKQLKKAENMSGRDAILGFEKAREEFFKESNILRILHHPHLVQANILRLASFRGLITIL